MMAPYQHTPVMVREVVKFLKCSPSKIYVDGTVGGGGHAKAILENSSPSGMLLGIDKDASAVAAAVQGLNFFGGRVKLTHGSFSEICNFVNNAGMSCVDGVLLDLGVSSHQLKTPSRGFGFSTAGPLDMRMDLSCKMNAAEFLRSAEEAFLAQVIFEFGEERYARRIARNIVARRQKKPILTTKDLADIVCNSVPRKRGNKIHPATRAFQAIRIFINDELEELKSFLKTAPKILCPEGRLAIISYHSLEDRLVKQSFREWERNGGYQLVTRKVVVPSADEKRRNPRSRSAKLRVLEREGRNG